jgi:diadenosine tetraphosphate (Ap4A) HIT family hydrolase
MPECFTCRVNAGKEAVPGGTIYEDEWWVGDHGVTRLVRGYVVLKRKRHVHELADLLPVEAETLGVAAQKLLAAMRGALGTERIYICSFAETGCITSASPEMLYASPSDPPRHTP